MNNNPSYHNNKQLTVINFFPGPGVGKSTLRMGLTYEMKRNGIEVEYIPEIVREYIWHERYNLFPEQDYIFAEQNQKLRSLVRTGVKYAIMDGPLLLSHFYSGVHFPLCFHDWVDYCVNSYTNINIVVNRVHPYNSKHRNEDQEQSNKLNQDIVQYLKSNQVPFITVNSDYTSVDLFNLILENTKYMK